MGTLLRVEKLTDIEKENLLAVEEELAKVTKKAAILKATIGDAHNMNTENWLEWRSWVEFDGDFILFRRRFL